MRNWFSNFLRKAPTTTMANTFEARRLARQAAVSEREALAARRAGHDSEGRCSNCGNQGFTGQGEERCCYMCGTRRPERIRKPYEPDPRFPAIVVGFNGIVEVRSAPRVAFSDDGRCPKCQWSGIQRLSSGERRCARCGEQFLTR